MHVNNYVNNLTLMHTTTYMNTLQLEVLNVDNDFVTYKNNELENVEISKNDDSEFFSFRFKNKSAFVDFVNSSLFDKVFTFQVERIEDDEESFVEEIIVMILEDEIEVI